MEKNYLFLNTWKGGKLIIIIINTIIYKSIILLLFVISFMQSVHNGIPERNYISRVTYSFAGILYLQKFVLHELLLLLLLTLYYYLKQIMFLWYKRSFAALLLVQHTVHLMFFSHLKYFLPSHYYLLSLVYVQCPIWLP
jgi:hypothetical protein